MENFIQLALVLAELVGYGVEHQQRAKAVANMLTRAHDEGRDITDAELESARQDRENARADLSAAQQL